MDDFKIIFDVNMYIIYYILSLIYICEQLLKDGAMQNNSQSLTWTAEEKSDPIAFLELKGRRDPGKFSAPES